MNSLPFIIANLIALAFALYQGYHYGSQSVQAKWDTEKAEQAQATAKATAELQNSMDKLREEKNRETARLSATVRTLTNSLRSRPERPASSATSSDGDGSCGCTGAGLYKPDSQFLAGEAARADTLRLALITCQKAYQEASRASVQP